MKPQRPRTERRRKQREVAKKLDRKLKAIAARIMAPKVAVTTELNEWAGPEAVAKAQRYEQGETHGTTVE